MKGNIIVYVILVFIVLYIVFAGVGELKEAYTKGLKKGGGDSIQPKYTEPTYYDLNKVWDDPVASEFSYKGVSVPNTNSCNLYTYESFYSLDKTNEDGSLNTLVSEKFTPPSLSNVFEDLVNGFCHLTEITDYQKNKKCIDVDQIYAYRAKRTCIQDEETLNRCIDSFGVETPQGKDDDYNVSCSTSQCDGEIGCISLNYFSNLTNISENTRCMSVDEISVPSSMLTRLSFYVKLGIIKEDNNVNEKGPYPIKFGFKVCNTIDPRQKFKIIKYDFKVEPKVGGGSERVPVYNKKGSYGSIIFRALDGYLDMEKNENGTGTGNFVLRKIPSSTSNITETIKWIFMPRVKITRKTIPSSQRCSFLRSNFEVLGENPDTLAQNNKVTGKGLDILARSYLSNKVISNYGKYSGTIAENLARVYLGEKIAESFVLNALSAFGRFIINPALTIFAVIQIISSFVKQISYLDPPISSVPVPSGVRVSPTNFESVVNDGDGFAVLVESLCIQRELSFYPPYFLESITNNNSIFPEYINYKVTRGVVTTLKSVSEVVHGVYFNKETNLDLSTETRDIFKDKKTLWRVYSGPKRFLETLGYPNEYFKSKTGGVATEGLDINTSEIVGGKTSGYQISPSGITELEYENNQEQENKRAEIYFKNNTRPQPTSENEVPTQLSTDNPESITGSGCELTLVIATKPVSQESSVDFLSKFYISNPGKNYSDPKNSPYTIEAVSKGSLKLGEDVNFTLKFKVTQVDKIPYTFKALVKKGDKYFIPTTEDSVDPEVDKNYGYGLVIKSNYNPDLSQDTCFNYTIINSGFNYKDDGTVYYLGQFYDDYDPFYATNGRGPPIYPTGKNLSDVDNDPAKLNLISFTVSQLKNPSYNFNELAPHSLTEEDLNVVYNFMDNSSNDYDLSPQQIVYGGEVDGDNVDLITKLSTSVRGNLTSDKVYQLFTSIDLSERASNFGIVQPSSNSIMNLKSLQISDMKYTSETGELQPSLTDNSSVILGRFIPYQKFTTSADPREKFLELETRAGKKQQEFLSWENGKTYYNWNNTQIIPYGIRDIYTNVNFIRNPPSF